MPASRSCARAGLGHGRKLSRRPAFGHGEASAAVVRFKAAYELRRRRDIA